MIAAFVSLVVLVAVAAALAWCFVAHWAGWVLLAVAILSAGAGSFVLLALSAAFGGASRRNSP